jgi:hypothetical protein
LLLMVDKKIEAHLQVADDERQAESSRAYAYHTNAMELLQFSNTQIQDALASQETRLTDKLDAEARRISADLHEELLNQIKLLTPDATEIARRNALAADLGEVKRALAQIQSQLARMTNVPAARP